ncbi:TlpA family protein disulfide reductase [Parasphingorhabdus halotolerans]|uniref:TlpA family protein disulfide reductase n=1 Tax=Parasphingorhabdus halotolerans TaxID=2725558 RepID=A0A6H2DLA0_9SPHN|nr:TlpA disulfide reductase family protein [Parasphingorhabdus halotolerans]QJB69439.1 TlpA family protein disulfide reductase [Parasphingorhabdus halotolerans]
MTDEGPSANLPPHIALEFLVASLIRYILLVLIGLALASCDRGSSEAEQDVDGTELTGDGETIESDSGLVGKLDISQRGSDMLDVVFEGPDGNPVRLSDFKGKPLLINIWATWCAPCVVEMPMLDELAAREEDRLEVIVVSQDLQGAEKVDPFFERADFKMLEPYIDPENGLSFGFGTGLMPTTVLYDESGKEVWRVIGAMDWDGARAATLMEETLSEK